MEVSHEFYHLHPKTHTIPVVALAEVVSKYVMGSGVASSMRPRKYYKIPKESLEASLDDLEQLVNFFVIEFQRILFAENVPVTIAVSLSNHDSGIKLTMTGIRGLIHLILLDQASSHVGYGFDRYLRRLPGSH